jgi:MarR family transcriptional regulator for hemolysin
VTTDDHAIGMLLWSTTQVINRAFDRILAEAGCSRPMWFILMALRNDPPPATQRELADRIELREATLSHHLNAMEQSGLVLRTRGAENRRVVRVDITDDGRALVQRVLASALAFNEQMRESLGADAVPLLRGLRTLRDRFSTGERIPPPL